MFLITRLNHIGIIVGNIEEAIKPYQKLFDVKVSEEILMEKYHVKLAYLSFANIELEFIEPLTNQGEFYNFLKEGGGLHHIAVEVNDIYSMVNQLKENQFKLMDEKPKIGARDSLMVFSSKESFDGVTVEFKQLHI